MTAITSMVPLPFYNGIMNEGEVPKMKYASEDLIQEHVTINIGLDILERMTLELKAGRKVHRADAEGLVQFFVEFADSNHHGKEEGLLFPAMDLAGIPNENGPIGIMLSEHVEGRAAIARMKKALKDGGFDTEEFIGGAESYFNLLRTHIRKENMILFPLGDKRIPEEQEAELLTRFARHEADVMGPDVRDRFHALLDRLMAEYPGGAGR